MILSFTVEVDVPYQGESNVPYLKHLLSSRGSIVGTCKVSYDKAQTNWMNEAAPVIEQAEWEKGNIEI